MPKYGERAAITEGDIDPGYSPGVTQTVDRPMGGGIELLLRCFCGIHQDGGDYAEDV